MWEGRTRSQPRYLKPNGTPAELAFVNPFAIFAGIDIHLDILEENKVLPDRLNFKLDDLTTQSGERIHATNVCRAILTLTILGPGLGVALTLVTERSRLPGTHEELGPTAPKARVEKPSVKSSGGGSSAGGNAGIHPAKTGGAGDADDAGDAEPTRSSDYGSTQLAACAPRLWANAKADTPTRARRPESPHHFADGYCMYWQVASGLRKSRACHIAA